MLSLPPIFLLLLLLILKNENRQIAIRRMCQHATGDITAVAGRRIEYFLHKHGVKALKVPDFGRFPYMSTYLHCLVRVDLTKLILNHLPAFFDICHPLTAPSSFLRRLPSCRFTRLFLICPESETTITLHQRHSQYCS